MSLIIGCTMFGSMYGEFRLANMNSLMSRAPSLETRECPDIIVPRNAVETHLPVATA